MKFGASQLRFEDLHYSLSDGYVATRLLFRLICNLPELNIWISGIEYKDFSIRLLPIYDL